MKCFVHQDLVQALKSNKEISQDLHSRGKIQTPSLQFRVWGKRWVIGSMIFGCKSINYTCFYQ